MKVSEDLGGDFASMVACMDALVMGREWPSLAPRVLWARAVVDRDLLRAARAGVTIAVEVVEGTVRVGKGAVSDGRRLVELDTG